MNGKVRNLARLVIISNGYILYLHQRSNVLHIKKYTARVKRGMTETNFIASLSNNSKIIRKRNCFVRNKKKSKKKKY